MDKLKRNVLLVACLGISSIAYSQPGYYGDSYYSGGPYYDSGPVDPYYGEPYYDDTPYYRTKPKSVYRKKPVYKSNKSYSTQKYGYNKAFIFNPRKLSWVAVSNGKVVKSGKASGGSKYCSDVKRACKTPSGTYRVISKGDANCRSSRYPIGRGGAKMPYCMFFNKNYAIHGSYELPNYNASHGCIRVRPEDARWLHQNFMSIGTKVVVHPY